MAAQNDSDKAVIVIRRGRRRHGGGHHGGAWKVAYADFVTAMMAFFLLLWLLNVTTDEQKLGIADYFSPASVAQTTSGSGGILGGRTLTSSSNMASDSTPMGVTVALPAPLDDDWEQTTGGSLDAADRVSDEVLDDLLAEREAERFERAAEALRQAIESIPELKELSDSLLIDQTPEGMRIQIVDQAGYSMFPNGSAEMLGRTRKLLALVADAIGQLPNAIIIKGHTDATPYANSNGYSNWELSTDRANASRRALLSAGLSPERIASVVGLSEQQPLVPEDPYSPRNRRISIILLREKPPHGEVSG